MARQKSMERAMSWIETLKTFEVWDLICLGVFIFCWLGYPLFVRLFDRKDLTTEMVKYRRFWLEQMLSREDRITDISLARGLFSSVMFLASTSIFLIGGLIGVLATAGHLHDMVLGSAWFVATSLFLFETKIIFLILIQVHSFFKFTWSMRLHSYSMILIGAAPGTHANLTSDAKEIVSRGVELSSLASQSYFIGLRGYYFGLAALTWFVSPQLLIVTTLLTLVVLIRREHFSQALHAVAGPAIT
jgi:uncharacterized membrane protein